MAVNYYVLIVTMYQLYLELTQCNSRLVTYSCQAISQHWALEEHWAMNNIHNVTHTFTFIHMDAFIQSAFQIR